jgi:hypothetical protein
MLARWGFFVAIMPLMDWNSFWYAIGNFFGVVNEAGPGYGFFSGVGSDIGELAIIGGIIQLYRHHNCHVQGCWRLGRFKHTQGGQEYLLCKHHHPRPGIDAEAIE